MNIKRPFSSHLLRHAVASWAITCLSVTAFGDLAARADEPPPGFVESVDVRVVEIEAVVTHRQERVEGLTAEDFLLEVDGAPTPIEFFTEVRSGRLAGDSSAGSVPGTDATEGSGVVPTYFLVFVDDYFSLPNRRDQALRRLEEQLGRLRPEDRMAVVAYDGKVVDMLSNWTRDDGRLADALRRAAERPAYGLQRRSEWQQAVNRIRYQGGRVPGSSFAGVGFAGSGLTEAGRGPTVTLDSAIAGKVSRVADAAASSLRAFAGPEGRRVMILLSGGLPGLGSFGLQDRPGLFGELDGYSLTRDARRLLSPAIEAANLLGYTLYPVDMGYASTTFGTADVGSLGEARLRRRQLEERQNVVEDSLYHLADETGGLALFRGGGSKILEQVTEDTRSYYSIGFTPSWKADDRPRRIELKVQRKGHKVRARHGFADLSRSTLMSFQVESAHQFDVPLPEARDLEVELGESVSAGLGKVHVPVRLEIPLDALALLPADGGLRAGLELRIAATDDQGRRAELGTVPVELVLEEGDGRGRTASWETTLLLRKRDHRLLLALYDPVGDTLLARRVELEL